MKRLLQPKILIPVILSAALIAALLAFANVQKLVALMEGFQKIYLIWFLLLMVAYEVVRGAQWHLLLHALDIHVPLRTQIFAFAGGEVTKSMPIGNYFQNYLLQQSKGSDFGRTSAATTIIILIEVVVSLIGVVLLGLGSWSGWLRPIIVVGVGVILIAVWAYRRFHLHPRTPRWIREHRTMRKAMDEFKQFREGAADLFHPRVLGPAMLLGAAYTIIAGAALYLVVRGLNVNGASLPETLAVYYFSLGFSLMIPIPVDVGVLEISGVGAFLAVGVSKNAAVGAMLINRVLSIAASIAIAGVVMLIFHGEFRAALKQRSDDKRRKSDTAEAKGTP